MRFVHTILTIAVTLVVLGCNRESNREYPLDIESSVVCTFDEQVIDIRYAIYEAVEGDISISATSDASWITSIDTTTPSIIKVGVAHNDGDNRTATITIKATGHATAHVEVMQFSAPPAVATHTLMYFFFGTSLGRYFNTNIDDAKSAIESGILGNSNRVVYFRQRSAHEAYIGELSYDITSGQCIDRVITDDITLSGPQLLPEDMGGYIAQMAASAPAERYGIIFAGHGQGWITREILEGGDSFSTLSTGSNVWIPTSGADVTRAFGENNVRVDITEMAEGIEHSGIELDYILFDACFMSNIESIYELRDKANYIIASPCEIMGKGFPYHRTLPYLFADYGKSTDYKGAAESYYIFYRDEYSGNSRCGSVAVYDCREIDALAEATADVVATAKGDYDITTLQTYEGQSIHQFYDFGQWANVVATDAEAIAAFNAQLDRCVIAKYTLPTFYSAYGTYGTYDIDVDVYSGVTTSAPSEAYPAQWQETNWYKAVWE